MRSRSLLALAAALPLLATAQAPCCAYGGSGGATMIADGSLVLPGPGGAPGTRATLATVALGAGVSARGNGFTSVLVGSREGPEASAAGWVIEQNATGQASRPPPPPPPMPMPMPMPTPTRYYHRFVVPSSAHAADTLFLVNKQLLL
jgi:hypothetical protein